MKGRLKAKYTIVLKSGYETAGDKQFTASDLVDLLPEQRKGGYFLFLLRSGLIKKSGRKKIGNNQLRCWQVTSAGKQRIIREMSENGTQ